MTEGARPLIRGGEPAAAPAVPQTANEAFIGSRKIVVRGGRWVFEDTGEPVQQ